MTGRWAIRGRAPSGANGGFTLLEVLVAVAIGSAIIAALYAAYFSADGAVEAAEERLTAGREARGAVEAARKEIEAALYSRDKNYTVFRLEERDFYGAPASRLAFTAFLPSRPGLSLIEYEAFAKAGRMAVKKRVSTAFLAERGQWFTVAEGIDSFYVEAFGAVGRAGSWDASLVEDPSGAMPEEVRITVAYGGDRGVTVSDVAAPRTGRRAR